MGIYKVGDAFKVIRRSEFVEGATVYLAYDDGSTCPRFSTLKDNSCGEECGCGSCAWEAYVYLQLIEGESMAELSTQQKLKNLKLDGGERQLIDFGILESDGSTLTEEGKSIVLDYAFKAHQQTIIDDLLKTTTKTAAGADDHDGGSHPSPSV